LLAHVAPYMETDRTAVLWLIAFIEHADSSSLVDAVLFCRSQLDRINVVT